MIFVALVVAALVVSPLAGGRLRELAELRLRAAWLLLFAAALQAVALFVPGPRDLLHEAAYVGSYAPAAAFLWLNRGVPGLWLIGLGACLNLLAIAANGGVMPASPHALAVAGLARHPGGFSNSAVLVSPRLLFLGDLFAIPESWPFSNVFSIGDVCIGLGAFWAILRVTRRPRVEPAG